MQMTNEIYLPNEIFKHIISYLPKPKKTTFEENKTYYISYIKNKGFVHKKKYNILLKINSYNINRRTGLIDFKIIAYDFKTKEWGGRNLGRNSEGRFTINKSENFDMEEIIIDNHDKGFYYGEQDEKPIKLYSGHTQNEEEAITIALKRFEYKPLY